MKIKNTTLETFLNEVERTIDTQGTIRSKMLLKLIEKWKEIVVIQHNGYTENHIDVFRNLYHLKLSIDWIEKTTIYEKKMMKN